MHKTLLAGAAVAALGLAPAAAQADSLSFTKDDNIFVSAPDGSNLTQVTTDGEAGYGAYRSPTQADDGTVVAGRGDYIVYRSHKNDDLGKSDPPSAKDSRDVTADGIVHDVAIAPNGDKVAYSFVTLSAAPYTPAEPAWSRATCAPPTTTATTARPTTAFRAGSPTTAS
jgi:Tol biopolymer transport system component